MNKKKLFYNFLIFLICGLIAINNLSAKEKRIVVSGHSDAFVSIKVHNPFGENILIEPDDTLGGIGFILNDKKIWLKGEFTFYKDSSNKTIYIWEIDSLSILMETIEKEKNIDFTFRLKNKELKPSAWLINTKVNPEEYFTGIFERVVDGEQNKSWAKGITEGLNLRGQKVDVKLKPTVSAYAPFYISSGNYAIFVQGTWPGVIDFCKERKDFVQILFEGPELSFSLMMDKVPAELVKRHALKTGPSFVPPKWAFGPWRWRDEHFNNKKYYDGSFVHAPYNSQIVEEILLMQAYDIPCTAYWIDRPWAPGPDGFDDYEIDNERLPNFQNMIKWLESKNIKLMMWIAPYVMGKMADTAEAKKYFLISRDRIKARQVLIDFTNEKACKWWGENGPAKLAKMGIKGFKLDRADGEKLLDSLHLKTFIGTTYRENYNDFPRQYVKAAYDAVKPILVDDFILFPRAQYTGSAKYGGMWAGDTGNPPEGLRSVIIGAQRCAIMGYPIWGSDTGGYPRKINREVTKRWLGFSCFSPIMEVGPTNNRVFWDMDYEPSFDHELLAVWRFYAKLRMYLIDYIHHHAEVANKTGMPIIRPLFLEYPNQKECWEDWTTYKFGNDILVSIIWEEGKTKKSIYLPAGEIWIDQWNKKEYKGGTFIEVDAPDYKTPLFIRKGSKLQLPDLNELYRESVEITKKKFDMNILESSENWLNN
ncbi:MAG: glycoside hydrolase family 31 protein [Melioribacter sp.]|uniref:TIM-barrel domain-containing protein n=1 Tax=Rosettibacter primus TaxID=3111523 RepID=UPI00247CCBFA|nr:glycoside hydrolase family 31 protein [Melioribacter sp.]